MKYFIILLTALCSAINANSQINAFTNEAVIEPYTLNITWHKTTILVFPFSIKSADRGDSYILAEKVKGADNVLRVKAGLQYFEQSNLHVITADGKVYPFTVNYVDTPSVLTVDLRGMQIKGKVSFGGVSLNQSDLERYSEIAASAEPFMEKGKYSKHGIKFLLQGTYIKSDVMFLRYNLQNSTNIGFNAESLRFYIRDKKKVKRTAIQDTEQEPLYVRYVHSPEDPGGQTIVVALPKFTIAEDKFFEAEIMERNGDRNPVSKLYQKQLLKAEVLE